MQRRVPNLTRIESELRRRFLSYNRLDELAGLGAGVTSTIFRRKRLSPRTAAKIAAALSLTADDLYLPESSRKAG